jgi:ribosomal protein S18 acetylase RimI-like enzyme
VGSIRVWLEPGYDHGRTGAWLLDSPGAFTWGSSRETALARVPSALRRFDEWLADHGETPSGSDTMRVEVVEEVPAYRREDGYEVNATFDADRRSATPAELDTTVRRLGYAREGLLQLVDQIRELESGGRQLALEHRAPEALVDGASDGRATAEVLRHIAGAETWFVSRLDRQARYDGPRDDVGAYLAASREFLVSNLARLVDEDAGRATTDGKGEEWTLAKVFRRALYHSLDHFGELDRRLAQADGRTDGVEIRTSAQMDVHALQRLFAATGIGSRLLENDELMAAMLAGSTEIVSAWDGDQLVGFGRLISDGATVGYISTIAIAPRWQDRGLGTRLMRALMNGRDGLKLILEAREGAGEFYERLGFQPSTSAYVRRRKS